MNENNFGSPQLRYQRKTAERLAKVQESLDFDKDILEYVSETMSDSALTELRQRTIDALTSSKKSIEDIKKLSMLEQSITIKIGYLGEKSHDTEEDEEYLVKLGLMRDKLLEIIS